MVAVCVAGVWAQNSTAKIRKPPGTAASRTGSAVAWRTDLAKALAEAKETGKPVFWYVPTVAGSPMDRKPELDRVMLAGPFSWPEAIAILGERFVTAGCCFYRDGRDSVAWHGDRIGRGRHSDTMVAIVSFGDPRRLALRPRGGGDSIAVEMGHGDLVVMGGSCQRTWEHSVPKAAHAGPRISVQFRPLNVF